MQSNEIVVVDSSNDESASRENHEKMCLHEIGGVVDRKHDWITKFAAWLTENMTG